MEVRVDNQQGALGASVAASTAPQAITGLFAVAPAFPHLLGGDFVKLVFQPNTPDFDIAYLTVYDPSSPLDGTVVCGREGTSAVGHSSGDPWGNNPVASTFQVDPGQSQDSAIAMQAVDVLAFNPTGNSVTYPVPDTTLPSFTHSEPTLTATANAALTIDGIAASVDTRVLVLNQGVEDGIYVVTAVGDGSHPWVLTRSDDASKGFQLGADLTIRVKTGTAYASAVARWFPFGYGSSYILGTSNPGFNLYFDSDSVNGPSFARGVGSIALGTGSVADGLLCVATSLGGIATGEYAFAYSGGQRAHSSEENAVIGDSQTSAVTGSVETTDATPTVLNGGNGAFLIEFVDGARNPVWNRSARVRGRVVARRTDTPGTESSWDFDGLVRGNGSSALSWVGGSAPTPSVFLQDAGASTWAVSVAIASNTLTVEVTGQVAKTISWTCVMELDEVAG